MGGLVSSCVETAGYCVVKTLVSDVSPTGGNASCVYIPTHDLHSTKPRTCLSRGLGEKIDTNL